MFYTYCPIFIVVLTPYSGSMSSQEEVEERLWQLHATKMRRVAEFCREAEERAKKTRFMYPVDEEGVRQWKEGESGTTVHFADTEDAETKPVLRSVVQIPLQPPPPAPVRYYSRGQMHSLNQSKTIAIDLEEDVFAQKSWHQSQIISSSALKDRGKADLENARTKLLDNLRSARSKEEVMREFKRYLETCSLFKDFAYGKITADLEGMVNRGELRKGTGPYGYRTVRRGHKCLFDKRCLALRTFLAKMDSVERVTPGCVATVLTLGARLFCIPLRY